MFIYVAKYVLSVSRPQQDDKHQKKLSNTIAKFIVF